MRHGGGANSIGGQEVEMASQSKEETAGESVYLIKYILCNTYNITAVAHSQPPPNCKRKATIHFLQPCSVSFYTSHLCKQQPPTTSLEV